MDLYSNIEQLLHAYVDGELGKADKLRVQAMMQEDESIRERVNELRNAKEWIKQSFAGECAPTRSLPQAGDGARGMPVLRIAASFLLAVVTFAAGWFGHSVHQESGRTILADSTVNTESLAFIIEKAA